MNSNTGLLILTFKEVAEPDLVAVGIPVAVKTPVGIVVVLTVLSRAPEDVLVVITGGALITLDGGAEGLPAMELILDPGVFQLED